MCLGDIGAAAHGSARFGVEVAGLPKADAVRAMEERILRAEAAKEAGNASLMEGNAKEATARYEETVALLEYFLSQEAEIWRVVHTNNVAVREEPTVNGRIIGSRSPGARVHVASHQGDWVRLHVSEGWGLRAVWMLVNGSGVFQRLGVLLEPEVGEELRQRAQFLCQACRLNSAQASLKLCDWEGAVAHASWVLAADEDNPKALYRRAVASAQLDSLASFEQARDDLERLISLKPRSYEAKDQLRRIEERLNELRPPEPETVALKRDVVHMEEHLEQGPKSDEKVAEHGGHWWEQDWWEQEWWEQDWWTSDESGWWWQWPAGGSTPAGRAGADGGDNHAGGHGKGCGRSSHGSGGGSSASAGELATAWLSQFGARVQQDGWPSSVAATSVRNSTVGTRRPPTRKGRPWVAGASVASSSSHEPQPRLPETGAATVASASLSSPEAVDELGRMQAERARAIAQEDFELATWLDLELAAELRGRNEGGPQE